MAIEIICTVSEFPGIIRSPTNTVGHGHYFDVSSNQQQLCASPSTTSTLVIHGLHSVANIPMFYDPLRGWNGKSCHFAVSNTLYSTYLEN